MGDFWGDIATQRVARGMSLGNDEEAVLDQGKTSSTLHTNFEKEELEISGAMKPLTQQVSPAAWLKFEEDVEDGGERWSKPYVATLSLHSLFELRSCILNGTVLLDMRANSIEEIADMVIDSMLASGQLEEELQDKVREALLKRHHHQNEKKLSNRIPLVRSFADIGKKHSDSHLLEREGLSSSRPSLLRRPSQASCCTPPPSPRASYVFGRLLSGHSSFPRSAPTLYGQNRHLSEPLPPGLSLPLHGHAPSGGAPRRRSAPEKLIGGDGIPEVDMNFMKKIPPGAEASNVLVGEVDFLEHPIIAFVRLSPAVLLTGLTEVPVPTRFLFLLLGPFGKGLQYHEIGRSIATLMTDEVFHDVAYKAKDRNDLLSGIDEFLDQVTVLPPGEWDPSIRIEPPKNVPSQEKRKIPALPNGSTHFSEAVKEMEHHTGPELQRTGRIFGGLMNDVRRKAPFYWSDIKDALSLQCLASILFLYCACMSPVVTFGGLLGEATKGNISAIESLLGASMTGVAYSLFSGQPLTILGSTGPVLVFEKILFTFCSRNIRCFSLILFLLLRLQVRATISDFAVFLTIMIMVLLDYLVGIPSPKLHVPDRFQPTSINRGWLISPLGTNPWWTLLAAAIPALLCTILIFMDQQITAIIINRKENKLKKGCGYHLDLLVVAVMLGVCSIMGLPWFVAATVLSISHVNSLKVESGCAAPGEQPKFLGIREQRVTGFMIFVLMGCSVFMTSALKFIPMPVLYGVFLYMGASSLKGIQLFDRIKLFGMPGKHQPDLIYLRYVPLWKVHVFTAVQLSCLIILWVIKASRAAVVFPMMVLALVFIRKLLDFCFTKRELSWLDDLIPESKKKKDDDKKKKEADAHLMMEETEDEAPYEPQSILKFPIKSLKGRSDPSEVNISDEMAKSGIWKSVSKNSEGGKGLKRCKSQEKLPSVQISVEDEDEQRFVDAETAL
ncbi:PREDICTED: sodium bicarbonate cotransporter 3-like [Cyprinodon variegatus]|uniref:sodium bicarbonate cotransporter 3-like n=1 Tax=Cyprinodon variegatus TaxID=28743 RepID=UPI0007426A2E|nr:PREDICTED: sodium bicarbonate cotransporter 3-like [Cyprinodon variegatus]